ncbi:MAG TPA: hypothetical protein VMS18_05900 [Candidatus Binatia bacterium]|nr:hypothetical protein [Candidatus Binatia bacterium]
MVDVYEMLRQKENDIVRVRREIQALRVVAPMLSDFEEVQVLQPDVDTGAAPVSFESSDGEQSSMQTEESLEPPDFGQAIPPRRSRLRELLGLAANE